MKKGAEDVKALVEKIIRLAKYTGEHHVKPATLITEPGMICFDTEDRGLNECLYVNPETGDATLYTWHVSGHNHDPYNGKTYVLSSAEAMPHLYKIRDRFEALAFIKDEREQDKIRRQAALDEARARIRAKIGDY